jgi:hypothetical protein
MQGGPPMGLSIKAPNKTAAARQKAEENRQKKEEEKQKRYAETREKLKLGLPLNNNNNNNTNYSNVEKINISRWAVIPDNKEGEFFEVPVTPNPSPPSNTPPPMKRPHKTNRRFTKENYEENMKIPIVKRKRNNLNNTTKKAKVGGKRKVQRKTYRRHK